MYTIREQENRSRIIKICIIINMNNLYPPDPKRYLVTVMNITPFPKDFFVWYNVE